MTVRGRCAVPAAADACASVGLQPKHSRNVRQIRTWKWPHSLSGACTVPYKLLRPPARQFIFTTISVGKDVMWEPQLWKARGDAGAVVIATASHLQALHSFAG